MSDYIDETEATTPPRVSADTPTPEQAVAERAGLESATPGSTSSDAMSPDAISPESISPDAISPESIRADATGPEASHPEATSSDVTNADLTNADLTNADLTNAFVTGPSGQSQSWFSDPDPMERTSQPEPPVVPSDERRVIESYRPSPPIERVVRPIQPLDTSFTAPPAADTPATVGTLRPPQYPAPPPPNPSQPSRWPVALLAFASGLLGALLVLGGLFLGGVFDDEPTPTTTTAPAAVTSPPNTVVVREVITPEGAAGVATAVGLKVVPSIVTVEVGTGAATDDFRAIGSGSGVVFTEDGLIVTNHHVIQGAETSRVVFQDGRIYEAAIMGSDELTDIAVLKIQASGLAPIELGSTAGLRIGDRAIAVGNPLGLQGGASLTVGVVSAFDREVDTGDGTPLFGMLQTDAPITNGSSGGALVNAEGDLIGITTAIGVSQAGAEGIGFATPVEVVRRITDQIIETGGVAHAFLGVQLRTNFEIQDDGAAVPTGAVVAGFAEGSSAARDAGLQVEDVILSWNGNQVRTINDLINGIRSASVGESIELQVDRAGKQMTFEVVLGERPEGV